MDSLKRKLIEAIALYRLERELNDIYAEGNTDKLLFESFIKNKKGYRKILLIDLIDFSGLPIEYLEGLDINSNRNKAIIFSKYLNENIPDTNVKCIIDKDFDDYVLSIYNDKLVRTDFSCLESYLFCEDVLEKFLTLGITDFPFNSKLVLEQLGEVLKSIFCLRLLRELKFPYTKLVNIDGLLPIEKKSGKIRYDIEGYLNKFIQKNKLVTKSTEIINEYNNIFKKLDSDIRNTINGHDFLEIFYLYVNKIKNTHNFRIENFSRSLFLTVESSMIENYNLFKAISA